MIQMSTFSTATQVPAKTAHSVPLLTHFRGNIPIHRFHFRDAISKKGTHFANKFTILRTEEDKLQFKEGAL
jgi:hypothetical protein